MTSAPGISPDDETLPQESGQVPADGGRGGRSCPLSEILETSPDPAFLTTANGTVVAANEAFTSAWRRAAGADVRRGKPVDALRGRRRGAARRSSRGRGLLVRRPGRPGRRDRDRAASLGPSPQGPGILGRKTGCLRFGRHRRPAPRAGGGRPRGVPRRAQRRGLLRPPGRGALADASDGDGPRRASRGGRGRARADPGRQVRRGCRRAVHL